VDSSHQRCFVGDIARRRIFRVEVGKYGEEPTVGQIAAETSWSVRVGESFERIVGDWSFGKAVKRFFNR